MSDPYASVAAHYDIMVDWTGRITRERPFFEKIFADRGVRRVLDVGCATGHHSRLFADLGARVTGLDPSAAMLARARELTPDDNPTFVLGGFAEAPAQTEPADFIAVLGNTLAHVGDVDGLHQALTQLRAALAPGGALCLQVINYDSLEVVGARHLPLAHREAEGREYLFLREHRILGEHAEFTITTLIKTHGHWAREIERSTHVPLTSTLLTEALRDAGFNRSMLYGSYDCEPFLPETSGSLIVVAEG